MRAAARRPRVRRRRDGGAGTVLVVAVIGLAGLLVAVTVLTGRAVQARHRAQAAADLAALAAAAVREEGAAAGMCGTAADIAARNAASLAACTVTDEGDVTVTVRVAIGVGAGLTVPSSDGTARAGPADSQGP